MRCGMIANEKTPHQRPKDIKVKKLMVKEFLCRTTKFATVKPLFYV